MEVKQIYELVNSASSQALGNSILLSEDLSNLVEVGESVYNANAYDNFVRALVDKIGRTIISIREYKSTAPKVLKSATEYGSVVEKIGFELPNAQENESWELQDGVSYNQDIFAKPNVYVKFFDSKTSFEIQLSIADIQVKSAFKSVGAMDKFLSGLYQAVQNKLTLNNDLLVMRTINNFIGETIADNNGVRYVKLLTEYNALNETSLTSEEALFDKDFIRFATYKINSYIGKMKQYSTLFNIGGTQKFTPKERLHIVLHSEFKALAQTYLESDTFNKELVELPKSEEVAYWQGSGESFAVADTMAINVKTASDKTEVEGEYIVGVMFDEDALGVADMDLRVPTHRNAKAEFTNLFYKQDARYYNDLNENFVVFAIA